MAALSDYLESGLLSHIFKNTAFPRPSTIAIALTSSVPLDSQSGLSIPEIPSGMQKGATFVTTNYARINLGSPAATGDSVWNNVGTDTSTAYYVRSTEVGHSGYFYPLYLSSATAQSNDPGNLAQIYSFSKTFPGVSFYAPMSTKVSGDYSSTSPGYTEYQGNGFIKNKNQIVFNTALTDWGWVSGVAILDSELYGSGNLLMYAALDNPRFIYTGDSIKFDSNSLEISLN